MNLRYLAPVAVGIALVAPDSPQVVQVSQVEQVVAPSVKATPMNLPAPFYPADVAEDYVEPQPSDIDTRIAEIEEILRDIDQQRAYLDNVLEFTSSLGSVADHVDPIEPESKHPLLEATEEYVAAIDVLMDTIDGFIEDMDEEILRRRVEEIAGTSERAWAKVDAKRELRDAYWNARRAFEYDHVQEDEHADECDICEQFYAAKEEYNRLMLE